MNKYANKDCLDAENNMCCFFKVANAFLLLANLLLIIIGFHYMPTYTGKDSSYFSVIVAVLCILITVLVTWQIWQVIDTKNIVRQMQEQVDIEKRIREADYKKYSEQLSLFTYAANCANDAIMMMSELHHIVHNNLSSPRNQIGYNIVYKTFLASIRDALEANTPESNRLIQICLDNMQSCLSNAKLLKERYLIYGAFDNELDALCDNYYNEITRIYFKRLNSKQHETLLKLRECRKNLTTV